MADLTLYNPNARVAFDNLPYMRAIYWSFVRGDGTAGIQSRIELWDGAAAIALDQETHKVYVIKRQRDTRRGQETVIELPNGGINPGDTPLMTAQKELFEEVGAVAASEDDWVQLLGDRGMQPIDGLVITNQHAFLCLRANKTAEPEVGETEEVITMSFAELIELDNSNGFNDPLTPYFIRRAHDWLQSNRPDLLT